MIQFNLGFIASKKRINHKELSAEKRLKILEEIHARFLSDLAMILYYISTELSNVQCN